MKQNPKPPSNLPAFVRWLRSQVAVLDAAYDGLDDDPQRVIELGECCWQVVTEAADHAARLGLPEPQALSRATSLEVPDVKGYLAQCIALCQERIKADRPDRDDGMLSFQQAAAYTGYSERGFRKIVDRSRAKRSGGRITGPTVRFSQTGKKAKLLFRREWLDEFVEHASKQPSTDAVAKSAQKPQRSETQCAEPVKPSTGSAFGLDYSLAGKG